MKSRRLALKILLAFLVGLLLAGSACYFFPQQVLTVDSGEVTGGRHGGAGRQRMERAARAAELFKTGAAPLIICSGLGDAESNAGYLTNSGVPVAEVMVEPKSHSTRENAKFSIPLLHALGAKRVIIVTSWFHSRRALACFEHYAPDLTFYSRPSYYGFSKIEWNHNNGISGYTKAEYVKLLGYWVCYGVCPL